MLTSVVPLYSVSGPSAAVGSGFFAWHRLRVWLLTAAHMPRGEPNPQANWGEWPETIHAHRRDRLPVPLDLFHYEGGVRRPNFAFLQHDTGIADFIALPVSVDHFGSGGLLDDVLRLSLANSAPLVVGTAVRAMGFPTGSPNWPRYPACEQEADVIAVSSELIEFSAQSLPGLSGGPLVDADGRLAGLVIGNNGSGRAVSPNAMRHIIDRGLAEGL